MTSCSWTSCSIEIASPHQVRSWLYVVCRSLSWHTESSTFSGVDVDVFFLYLTLGLNLGLRWLGDCENDRWYTVSTTKVCGPLSRGRGARIVFLSCRAFTRLDVCVLCDWTGPDLVCLYFLGHRLNFLLGSSWYVCVCEMLDGVRVSSVFPAPHSFPLVVGPGVFVIVKNLDRRTHSFARFDHDWLIDFKHTFTPKVSVIDGNQLSVGTVAH